MPNRAMALTLPERPVQSERKAVRAGVAPELPLGDIPAKRAVKTEDERNAIRWDFTRRIAPFFDRACEVYLRDQEIKATELAERMTVDVTVLSQMRAGQRQITEVQMEVLRGHRPARAILAEADRPPPAITMSSIERELLRVVVEDAKRGDRGANAILDEVSRRLQVERGDVDHVIEQGDEHERAPGQQDA